MHTKKISILLFGITGDLSKRKILPALGYFSSVYTDYELELVGYSRSLPILEEIQDSLNKIKQHQIKSINFVQAEYTDTQKLQEIVSDKLQNNYELIIYLAIPPFLFENILKNLCIFGTQKIHIIIEKPFGESLQEAQKIIENIKNCRLVENVKFFDHYLFKDGTKINTTQKENIKNLFKKDNINQIEIKAKEFISIEGRESYYEKVGAIKDMLPSHLYSLTKIAYSTLDLDFNVNNLKISDVKLGQYKEYIQHAKNPNSKTETYFKVFILDELNNINLILESGKKLDKKETSIKILNNTQEIYWEVDPNPCIEINKQKQEIEISQIPEHAKLILDLLNNQKDKFLDNESVLQGWDLYNLVRNYINNHNIELEIY